MATIVPVGLAMVVKTVKLTLTIATLIFVRMVRHVLMALQPTHAHVLLALPAETARQT